MAEDEDKDENENEGEDERLRRMGECEFRWRKEDRKTVKSVEKEGGKTVGGRGGGGAVEQSEKVRGANRRWEEGEREGRRGEEEQKRSRKAGRGRGDGSMERKGDGGGGGGGGGGRRW